MVVLVTERRKGLVVHDAYFGSSGIKSYVLEIFDSELSIKYSNGRVKWEPEHWNLEPREEIWSRKVNLKLIRILVDFLKPRGTHHQYYYTLYVKEAKLEAEEG